MKVRFVMEVELTAGWAPEVSVKHPRVQPLGPRPKSVVSGGVMKGRRKIRLSIVLGTVALVLVLGAMWIAVADYENTHS